MTDPQRPCAITARSVTRRYGRVVALDALDLDIARGAVTALLGPNGAGKTTFIDLVLGRARPDAGVVRVAGHAPGSLAARRGLGAMLQSAALVPQLTVREHVELHCGYYAHALPAAQVIERAGLGELARRRYATLSGGQQRRVQFALAICGRPSLLVLDEPTVALDAQSRRTCWTLIREYADDGAAVLLTTHLLEEAEALADRIVLLGSGRVVTDGTPAQIRARVGEQKVRCRTRLDAGSLAALPAVVGCELDAGRCVLRTTAAEATLRALLDADRGVSELEVARASLEEAMQTLSREAA